jgi:hypothetical protein
MVGGEGEWITLESLILNQFLHTIRNVEIMFVVLETYIARFEVPVRGDGVCSRFFVFPIPLEDIGACKPEFSRLAWTQFFTIRGNVFCAHVWEHFSYGADGGVPFVPWLNLNQHSQRGLGGQRLPEYAS